MSAITLLSDITLFADYFDARSADMPSHLRRVMSAQARQNDAAAGAPIAACVLMPRLARFGARLLRAIDAICAMLRAIF